jgi:hypothetical protein
VEILQQADAFKARLAAAVKAKGGAPPQGASAEELGWGAAGLPHPVSWSVPKGAGAKELQRISRQVGCSIGWGCRAVAFPRGCCWPRQPQPSGAGCLGCYVQDTLCHSCVFD